MLVLTWCVGCVSLAVAGWSGVHAARNRPVTVAQLLGAGLVAVMILIQMITAGVLLAGGHSTDAVLLWGYLLTALVLVPAAGWWALMDTSRWSSVVMLVAAFTVAILQLRIAQIWSMG